jgi:nucleoside-diphosphate-sugar epimerase
MKLIVCGATGFVGQETVIQALAHPDITSVIALTRRPLELPAGIETGKLSSVTLADFGHYDDDAKKGLGDADACIWYVSCPALNREKEMCCPQEAPRTTEKPDI